ncbi:MAG: hypothetical protein ACI3VR_00600 [Intestinibacter sp.]|uniref:hypothetical protein n=1 Tax=Intestinibacter sp. TaxID=1965304 RepID=UPI003F1840C3
MKCKDYRKVRGKKQCKHFLGNKVLEVDNRVVGREKYEVMESCKCRCALGKKAIKC